MLILSTFRAFSRRQATRLALVVGLLTAAACWRALPYSPRSSLPLCLDKVCEVLSSLDFRRSRGEIQLNPGMWGFSPKASSAQVISSWGLTPDCKNLATVDVWKADANVQIWDVATGRQRL